MKKRCTGRKGIVVRRGVIGLVGDTPVGGRGLSNMPEAYVERQRDMENIVRIDSAGRAMAKLLAMSDEIELPVVVGADLDEFLANESLDRIWVHNPNLPTIEEVLPHREPRVRADGALECVPGKSATTFYRVKDRDTKGHFNVCPGVELAEAAAQSGAYAIMMQNIGETGAVLDEIRDFKFSGMVLAGDTITCETEITERDGDKFVGLGVVKVDGLEVARGVIVGSITKLSAIEKGPTILAKRRARARADAIATGVHPHLALAPRE